MKLLPMRAWLGSMYREGQASLVQSDRKAVALFRQAAFQGEMTGQSDLGTMYEYGWQGVTKNKAEALRWYLMAANQGYSIAQYNAGGMYCKGQGGVALDYKLALYWLTLATKGGISRHLPCHTSVGVRNVARSMSTVATDCRAQADTFINNFKIQSACVALGFTKVNFCNGRGTPFPDDDSVQRTCRCDCTGGYTGNRCDVTTTITTTTATTTRSL